jgi:Fur family transcriptional regulator, zinc uptake regulator
MKRIGAKKRQVSNHELVLTVLQKTGKPLTAYELLDRLRSHGVSAPPTVYRALDRLIEDGRVHRLESLNAFVACAHPQHGGAAVFSICHSCGTVEEMSDASLDRRIATLAKSAKFHLVQAVLELRGRCRNCGATT